MHVTSSVMFFLNITIGNPTSVKLYLFYTRAKVSKVNKPLPPIAIPTYKYSVQSCQVIFARHNLELT